MKWYTSGKENNKVSKVERKLRRMARILNKISKKYGFTYVDAYFMHGTSGVETINIRAKSKDEVAFDSFAFIE